MSLKVINVIGKNLKEMRRSKLSSLIIIIGPILIIFLAGFVFSTNSLQGVKLGIYEEKDTILGDNLIQKFREKSFEVEEMQSLKECIDSVKTGQNNLCIQIEETSSNPLGKVDSRVNNNITLFVDYSKTSVVWTIISQVQSTIEEESKETTQVVLGSLSGKISRAINEINSKEDELDTLIKNVETIQNTMEESENEINDISNQLDPNVLANLNSFNNIMLGYIDDIENEFGETPTTSNMRNQLQEHSEDISAVTQTLQSFNSSNLQGKITTANQELDQELDQVSSELRSIKEGIRQINKDFDDFEGVLAEEILNPIPTKYNSVAGNEEGQTGQELKFFDYILPGLITMVIMFASILLTATLTIKERKTKAYLRSILTPTSKGIFTLGNYVTASIIILIQAIILLAITKLFFGSNIAIPFGLTFPSILIISSFFILAGIIIGNIFSSEETGVIASVCIGIIFLISSSMIMSIEAMPKILGGIIRYTPFVLAETTLRKIAIFQLPLANIIPELIILVGYLIVSVIIISMLQSSQKNKEVF